MFKSELNMLTNLADKIDEDYSKGHACATFAFNKHTIKQNLPEAKLDGNKAIKAWQHRHTLLTRSLVFFKPSPFLYKRGKKCQHNDNNENVRRRGLT